MFTKKKNAKTKQNKNNNNKKRKTEKKGSAYQGVKQRERELVSLSSFRVPPLNTGSLKVLTLVSSWVWAMGSSSRKLEGGRRMRDQHANSRNNTEIPSDTIPQKNQPDMWWLLDVRSQSTALFRWTHILVMDLTSLPIVLFLEPLFLDLKESLTYYIFSEQGSRLQQRKYTNGLTTMGFIGCYQDPCHALNVSRPRTDPSQFTC